MEYLFLVVVVLLLGFIVYQDISNRRERESLALKLMSKDVTEYKTATEPPPKTMKEEEETFLDVDDVPAEKLLKAKDNL